jgi:hypothetical protein
LEYVTIDGKRTFAEFVQVGDGAERATDQALNFGRAAIDFALTLASFALWGAAREHVVLGGDPAFAFSRHPFWDFVFQACSAQYDGVATAVENAPRGVLGESANDSDGANGVVGHEASMENRKDRATKKSIALDAALGR